MKNNAKSGKAGSGSRKFAENGLRVRNPDIATSMSEIESKSLVHELQVYQIELEMQNAELREARDEIDSCLEKYTNLYEHAPVGYVTLDKSGNVRGANLRASTLLGVNRQQLPGQPFETFISSAFRPNFNNLLNSILTGSCKESLDVELLHKNKSLLSIRIEAVISILGQECHLALIDLTAQKILEQELRESEERHQLATYVAKEAIWEVNFSTGTTHWNRSYTEIFGRPPEADTYGEWWLSHIHPDDRQRIYDGFQQAVVNGFAEWSDCYRMLKADGSYIDLQDRAIFIRDKAGKALKAVGAKLDITEQVKAKEEINKLNRELEKKVADRTAELADSNKQLQQANEEWLNTFNASSDSIFLLDTDHHITRANKATANLVCSSVEDIVGKSCHEVIHGCTMPPSFCPQCMLLEDFQSHTSEIFVEKLNKHLLVTVSPIFDAANNLVGSIHYAKDITPLKKVEDALKNAKIDLECKVAERTAELFQAYEEMKKVSFELIWAEEKERERIAGELHDQVGQFLLLAKIKLDEFEDRLSDISLRTCAADISSLIASSLKDIRSLTFRMRPPILNTSGIEASLKWLCSAIGNDYGLSVNFYGLSQCDPKLPDEMRFSLYHVARELLLNVVKHAKCKKAQLSITIENNILVISVADQGVGFDASVARMKHVNDGAYGLYNIRQRIKQLGGRIDIISAPGQGTTITLSVPVFRS